MSKEEGTQSTVCTVATRWASSAENGFDFLTWTSMMELERALSGGS